jgi:hypothetical protein
LTRESTPEELYQLALKAHHAQRYRQAVDGYELARKLDQAFVGQLAAFQLGVISTEIRLSDSESLAYCADVARGSGNLRDSLPAGSLPAPLPPEERANRYVCQALWPGPALPSPGHWDPVTRTMALDPGWVAAWLERLVSGVPLQEIAERLLAKWAISVNFQLMLHSAGPEAVDADFARTTGYRSYRYRWAKAWEEGICQLSLERNFADLVANMGVADLIEGLSWDPMPIVLYPEECTFVDLVLDLMADRFGLDRDELLKTLVAEFPDTRLSTLVTLLGGRIAEQVSPEFDKAVAAAVVETFVSVGDSFSEGGDLYSLAYEIGYKPFREAGQDTLVLTEIVAAQQALAVALPLATSLDELGVILGQGSSLATLRTLVELDGAARIGMDT